MKENVTAIERAFELAATGHFLTATEIKLQLQKEGYSHEQIEGPALHKQLGEAIAKARAAAKMKGGAKHA
jgi:hypothetical protein